jgi:hypothetical protein
MSHRSSACLVCIALALSLGSARAADEKNKIPDAAKAILEKADEFELYSLDPDRTKEKPKDAFHGWKVLGKTAIKDKKDRERVLAAVFKGVADSDGSVAACFNPRHGIRAVKGETTVELVICFECLSLEIWQGEKRSTALTAHTPQPALDKVLKDAGVTLPKRE